jgi:hypothetical protein
MASPPGIVVSVCCRSGLYSVLVTTLSGAQTPAAQTSAAGHWASVVQYFAQVWLMQSSGDGQSEFDVHEMLP